MAKEKTRLRKRWNLSGSVLLHRASSQRLGFPQGGALREVVHLTWCLSSKRERFKQQSQKLRIS